MRMPHLAEMILIAMPALVACGGDSARPSSKGSGGSASGGSASGGSASGGSASGGSASGGVSGGTASGGVSGKPFEIEGGWSFLGPNPMDSAHLLAIKPGSMTYTDNDGNWSSKWTIKTYDNDLHRFQIEFDSGSGQYLPAGKSVSGTYDLNGAILTVQVANGFDSYPPLQSAGTCTDANTGDPLPDCRLYVKEN